VVKEERRGPKEGKHSSVAVKIVTGFLASLIGLILTIVTIYLLPFLIGLVVENLYPSGEVPAVVYKAAWFISYLFALLVLIASTIKIYGFLKKNLDFDFLP